MTFLGETEKVLASYGFDLGDVRRIVVRPDSIEDDFVDISVDRFTELANFNYDCGLGRQEVMGIWMFGDGFMMYREEYDGSEWWTFVPLFDVKEGDPCTLKVEEYERMQRE